MKRVAVVLMTMLIGLSMAAAQQSTNPLEVHARTQPPTFSDQYCAGFITNLEISTANYVAGAVGTPDATRYGSGDIIFLRGAVLQQGAQFSVLRHSRDPNNVETFPGQRRMIRRLGSPYAEMGRVRVVGVQGENAIAHVEFACDAIVPGDLVVPYAPKPEIQHRASTTFNRFHLPAARVQGRMVMSRDFGLIASTGNVVYLDVGADHGVRVGDVFHAVRGYARGSELQADGLGYKAPVGEVTQVEVKRPVEPERLPRRILGEMLVLNVTPTSATALVTLALEEMTMGDTVEMHQTRD